ncbi:folate-binding protein YgfZ [soil metagenome]
MRSSKSVLLGLEGAVEAAGVDAGVAAHYGSFHNEQRTLVAGEGFVDLSHRDVFAVSGPDRFSWLNDLTSADFTAVTPGVWLSGLILSPQGHVEHFFCGVDDGEAFTAWTEPGRGEALVGYLERMKFWSEVQVAVREEVASVWRPSGQMFVPVESLATFAAAAGPACGLWAYEALRIERGEPRFGLDTDQRTIPNEVGWVDGLFDAVALDKGCYRGQETVARVHNLGRPPRRLVLLHLDGSLNHLPAAGSAVVFDGREVGFVGTSARHHELGPIALGVLKRSVDVDIQLTITETVEDGGTLEMPATQEVIVDPEVGLHFRPTR